MARFLASDRERLAGAHFLDGRTPFSDGPEKRLPLSSLHPPDSTEPPRLVMHMSFCGSTQLAQLLGASGAALVLKEPQALVDLADWQRSMVEQNVEDARFGPVLRAATGLLSRRWPAAPRTVIKPSNWANNLLPYLRELDGVRIVLVTIEARAFLRAVFRGGRGRLAFTSRAAAHLAGAAGLSNLVEAAIRVDDDPVDRAARLALVAHRLQRRLFDRGFGCAEIDYALVASDPSEALRSAAAALDLPLSTSAVDEATDRRASRDSKDSERPFNLAAQQKEDAEVERHHGHRFDRALDWASRTFDPVGPGAGR